jgi:hypothetical protein
MALRKYPRTRHAPWSGTISSDDKVHSDMRFFEGKEIVVTLKMDGENFQIYDDGYYHARSFDGRGGQDRAYVAQTASRLQNQLPLDWRIAGENLYAKHSIHYSNLSDYLLVFSIWDEHNMCLSWDESLEWFELLNLKPVPELYRGTYDEALVKNLMQDVFNGDEMEGYVARLADAFHYDDFDKCTFKCVRPNHVRTSNHWRYEPIVKNQLGTLI